MFVGATIASQSKHLIVLLLLTIVLFAASSAWLVRPAIDDDAAMYKVSPGGSEQISIPYPAASGNYRVKKLFYGSGTDKHRPEFGDEVN